jgi:hypothetical protein
MICNGNREDIYNAVISAKKREVKEKVGEQTVRKYRVPGT